MCLGLTSILKFLMRFDWSYCNHAIVCESYSENWIVYGVSVSGWRACATFLFRVRGYLVPCRSSRKESPWMNGWKIMRERRCGEDYLRNALPGP